jgi:predicted DNA-binding transcriptional regulator AlpA
MLMAHKVNETKLPLDMPRLPAKGWKRASEILPFLPFKKSSLWKFSADGRFPKPARIHGMTCWSCEAIHEWMDAVGQTQQPEPANDAGGA